MKEYKIKINGNDYAVTVMNVEDNQAEVEVNGTTYKVDVEGMAPPKVTKTPKIVPASTAHVGSTAKVSASTSSPAATAVVTGGGIKSPLPGTILDVMVREGDAVKVGQHLMMLEAMKMENNIDADRDGTVVSIKVRKGDSVLEGDLLITIG